LFEGIDTRRNIERQRAPTEARIASSFLPAELTMPMGCRLR